MDQKERITKRLLLLYPDGTTIEDDIEKLWTKTLGKEENNENNNDYFKAIQRLKLADREPDSDKGHFTFFPKGALIFDLLSDWAENIATDMFEAFPVRTPVIYRWNNNGVQGQMKVFDQELYKLETPEQNSCLILRPNADIGLFKMIKGENIFSKNLPIRFYENANCFRLGQSGSLSGLKRARSFSLVDIHSLCANMEQGLKEYADILNKQALIMKNLGLAISYQFKTTEEFYTNEFTYLASLARTINAPILLEIYSGQRQYWALKNFMFTSNGYRTFHTQLDFDNAEHYGLSHQGENGQKEKFVIIHNSLATIERWLIIFISEALKKNPPILPLWLAPTQIRLLPVNEKHREFCATLSSFIKTNNIRVDIDDRQETIGLKIRRAEEDWIPYTITCGDKENNFSDHDFTLRWRGGKQQKMKLTEITKLIIEQTKNLPFRRFPGLWLSERPSFI